MRYISTRGGMARKSFSKILLAGLASDGGLVIPETYPVISSSELRAWRNFTYQELAFEIFSRFSDDILPDDLRDIIQRTYTAEIFQSKDIVTFKTLEPGLHILGLSNGPTLAFKDIAMQLLGNLFEYVLAETGKELNILGATSGDTGSSAEYAMRNKHGIRIFMLSPQGKMSRFQTAQMFSLQDPNIFNIAICGVFDSCQDIVKNVSNDLIFKKKYSIGTVNSINWARIAAQIVYYFKGYFSATCSNTEQVMFSVPSGNFGNIYAGYVASMMGLPIKRLVLATNENDVLHEFFLTGLYRPRAAKETLHTSSPSMDISRASNFERFIFDMSGKDANKIIDLWQAIDNNGTFNLIGTPLWEKIKNSNFVSGSSNHEARIATIRKIYEQYGMLIDTHTADGLKVGLEYRETNVPMICMETALPIKFPESILEATGHRPPCPAAYKNLENLPQRYTVMNTDTNGIKTFIIEHV
ncbi:MAG: threonine synthase [Nitrosospira sp.]|nr:threonine synthase [Nitrosospira sp.]